MCLAVPGKVMEIVGDDPLLRAGKVSFGGILKDVNLACVPEAKVGDYVIVHAGLAISILDEQEAAITLEYLDQINLLAAGEQGSA
jgi:hydrogenase expression/formation protein HypC